MLLYVCSPWCWNSLQTTAHEHFREFGTSKTPFSVIVYRCGYLRHMYSGWGPQMDSEKHYWPVLICLFMYIDLLAHLWCMCLYFPHLTRFSCTVKQKKRIWPLSDFLGVLPDHVVLAEDEEGPVDGEAVLPDRDGVVQGHGAGTLRFGLLEGWGDATCGHGRPIAVSVALGPSIPWAQQARDVVSKAGHSVKSKPHGREDSVRRETEREVIAS